MNPVPRAARIGFTFWMLFWVPLIWWAYGPQNFFWLCNAAQFLVLYAVWTNHRLLLSSQACAVTVVGVAWALDFIPGLFLGGSPFGVTAYMWDGELPLAARVVSLYHLMLPVFLIGCLWHTGYDRRGPWLQSGIGAGILLAGWLWTEPERNINWMYEPFGMEQVWVPDPVYVLLALLAYPLVLFFPGHFLLRWILARRS